MPMSNNGFKWRPNDNSAKTLLRYELEAEKWVNAVNSAQRRSQPRSISKDFAFIGMLLQLIFSVALLILLGLLMLIHALIKWVRSRSEKGKGKKGSKSFLDEDDRLDRLVSPAPQRQYYYKKGGTFFHNDFGRLRMFWHFWVLLIFIFLVEVIMLGVLEQFWPQHFRLAKDTAIFAGLVSFYFALTGMGEE